MQKSDPLPEPDLPDPALVPEKVVWTRFWDVVAGILVLFGSGLVIYWVLSYAPFPANAGFLFLIAGLALYTVFGSDR